MDNKIRLMRHVPQSAIAVNPNRYEFNPNGHLLWLQRLLFKILGKLKANAQDTIITYSTTEIDTSKILEALMRNRADVEALYYKKARYVVMGVEAFAEFSNLPEVRNYLRFDFSTQIGMNRRITVMGLECIVVPWIEGFFVLPDLNEDRAIAFG